MKWAICVALTTAALWLPGCASNGADDPGAPTEFPDVGWPRSYSFGRTKVVMYQPQLESWENYEHLPGRSAVAVTLTEDDAPVHGAMYFEVMTETSFTDRQVLMKDFKIQKLVFPGVPPHKAKDYELVVEEALPFDQGFTASLDRVLASVDASQARLREVNVNLDPPPIFHSQTSASLVIFNGEPRFEPIEGTDLRFATNTNWDFFQDADGSQYYLRNEDHWFQTADWKNGPWEAVRDLPDDFTRLPDDDNWSEVKENVPGQRADEVPRLIVSESPAELILINGEPHYEPVPGTHLVYVENTDSDLFMQTEDEGAYYLLTAGRWFRAADLDGPWESALADLPDDFQRIPVDHEMAYVRSSVPGTEEAEVAMVLASIPQKATVNRSELQLDVSYEGGPEFRRIQGTTVYYAVNTPYDVFRVEDEYYCCHAGVWFTAKDPAGPWVVADFVPNAIYDIPPDCPKHHVTYVHVYGSTSTTVVTGYTSGYYGCYVTTGVVVYGSGYYYGYPGYYYYYDPWYYYHCGSHYYSYGSGAWYNQSTGVYYAGAYSYGPYGGVGYAAAYDPATGAWSRSAYRYGPSGEAYARQAYNPQTGRYAAGVKAETPYGSWGRGVVSDGDNWARGGYRSDGDRTVGGVRTSEGGVLVGGQGADGNQVAIGRDQHGDLYVGKDGDVYRRTDDQWQKKDPDGGWTDVEPSRPGQGRDPADRTGDRLGQREGLEPGTREGLGSRERIDHSREHSGRGTLDGLDRDRAGRERGGRQVDGGLGGRGGFAGRRGGGGFRGRRR